ncbi:thermonuclease family protein [Methanohalophilus mahii]|uniref:Nuclease (SNase domain protein) n=1 Tax=Methanohalophilus mahii (strain ATCC 35705 / DSM 5219 / SLP) TaxID=547558 RepID=D5EBL3_METMS|nr:thermonuclease family protein [Methanohalophilus mahii]ADE36564.1 nuclease (SNase domain protein) [Methanohalophilus mahii DSM 5219]
MKANSRKKKRTGWKSGTVKKCIDGDTLEMTNGDRIRLSKVRSPETYQKGGNKSTNVLRGMVNKCKKKIQYKPTSTKGSYNRIVAEVKNKDGSINERMRKKGYKSKGR